MRPNCATARMPRPGKVATDEDREYARLWRQSVRDGATLTRFFRDKAVDWNGEGVYAYLPGKGMYVKMTTLSEVEQTMKAGIGVRFFELGDLTWQLRD